MRWLAVALLFSASGCLADEHTHLVSTVRTTAANPLPTLCSLGIAIHPILRVYLYCNRDFLRELALKRAK